MHTFSYKESTGHAIHAENHNTPWIATLFISGDCQLDKGRVLNVYCSPTSGLRYDFRRWFWYKYTGEEGSPLCIYLVHPLKSTWVIIVRLGLYDTPPPPNKMDTWYLVGRLKGHTSNIGEEMSIGPQKNLDGWRTNIKGRWKRRHYLRMTSSRHDGSHRSVKSSTNFLVSNKTALCCNTKCQVWIIMYKARLALRDLHI